MSNVDLGNKQLFDPTGNNIIVINYPPGSFGNFLYLVLSMFVRETVSVDANKDFKFSESGNSHAVVKYTSLFRAGEEYVPTILNGFPFENRKILVKADSGLEVSGLTEIKQTFPNATIVRVAVDAYSSFLALHTFYEKVQNRQAPENAYEYFKSQGNLNRVAKWTSIKSEKIVNIQLTELALDPAKAIRTLIANLRLTMINEDKLDPLCAGWKHANREYLLAFKQYYNNKFKN